MTQNQIGWKMDLETLRNYCLLLKGTTEDLPFGPDTLVFRVMGKIFLLTGLDSPSLSINLKCDPEKAIELREQFEEIKPGYHMNKKLWNTVDCNNTLPDAFIRELIDHSYDEVVKKLSRKEKEQIDLF